MSKATKKKYVSKEVLEDFIEPEGEQKIARVLNGRGNNLHEILLPSGEQFLASMPTKFRRNVWIKRGDFVVVEPIEEGNKVKAEIAHILYSKQIKHLKKEGMWPGEFDADKTDNDVDQGVGSAEEDEDADLFVNTNRRHVEMEDEEVEEEEEEEEEEESSETR
jgi:probable RNA-binding protein EIF1AD